VRIAPCSGSPQFAQGRVASIVTRSVARLARRSRASLALWLAVVPLAVMVVVRATTARLCP
jgi:hypothetical protein